MSQIFKGDRELNSEQALIVASFLGLSLREKDYFLLLVQRARAGTAELKQYYDSKLLDLREKNQQLSNVVVRSAVLSEEAQAIYYSNWYFSGLRLLALLDRYHSIPEIAERLSLSTDKVRYIIEFLKNHGLCEEKNGRIKASTTQTHLASTSPHVSRHHTNWRFKAIERLERASQDELFYTGPMTISMEDLPKLRQEIVEFVSSFSKMVAESPSEQTACLNIDLFKF